MIKPPTQSSAIHPTTNPEKTVENPSNSKSEDVLLKQTKTSIQTQTSRMVDSEVQANFDSLTSSSENFNKNKEYPSLQNQGSKYEIPTKDDNQKFLKKQSSKQKEKPKENKIAKFNSSSPIKKTEKLRQSSENSNSSADLTKVSIITDKTPLQNSATLPVKTNSIKKPVLERQSTTSSITSTLSSICSSITNITARTSPIHIKSSSIQIVSNDTNPQHSSDFDKTITIHSNENSKVSRRRNSVENQNVNSTIQEKNFTDQNEYFDSFDDQENEFYETDDILRILFKKTYFYKLKLR